jgi:hypothetical protein
MVSKKEPLSAIQNGASIFAYFRKQLLALDYIFPSIINSEEKEVEKFICELTGLSTITGKVIAHELKECLKF